MGNICNKKIQNQMDATVANPIDNSQHPTETNVNVNEINSTASEPPKKCNRRCLWITIAIVAAVVIAGVIVAIILANRKKNPNPKPEKVDPITQPNEPVKTTPPTQTPDTTHINVPKTNSETIKTIPPPPPTNPKTTHIIVSETTTPPPPPPTPEITHVKQPTTTPETTIPEPNQSTDIPREPLERITPLNTNAGELKYVTVVQINNETTKLNDQLITTNTTRQTNYQVFILSEEEAKPEDQLFYNKMYTGAISIASECIITPGEKCELKEMVDLSKDKQDKRNLRLLENSDIDFKNIPIATCLFNITDNDFITSITCHKDFNELKKNEILLDLYFFRWPNIERRNSSRENITINIKDDLKNNRRYVREQNGGLCNIYNNWGSLCTTDMNITTDLEGNLVAYDEMAITNIIYDKHNSFKKEKKTNLVDHSESITKEETENYKNSLNKLLDKLKPYMKEDVQFTREQFDELYGLVKNKNSKDKEENSESKTMTKSKRRLSSQEAIQYIRKKELFHLDSLGVEINLNYKLNPGLNTDAMRSELEFSLDDNTYNMYEKSQLSDIQKIIDQLSALSKAGNILATQLMDKIGDKLEQIPNEITIKLKYLYDLVLYYDLFEVFNSTLKTISYNKLSSVVINLSTELENRMIDLYNNIDKKGNIKNTVEDLVNTIYDYVKNSHLFVDNIYYNISELSHTLLDKNNPFTQITNYYLNNTFISYLRMVNMSRMVFETYFEREFRKSYPKVQELIKIFEEKSEELLKNDREYIYDMYTRLLNGSYQIVDISKENLEKTLSNLLSSYNYTFNIIAKIKEYINEKIDIKDSGYYISNHDIKEKNKTYSSILDLIESVKEIISKDDLIDKTFDEIMINFKENYISIMEYMAEKKFEYFTLDENVLYNTLFTAYTKQSIELKIKEFTENILSKMKTEYDYKKRAEEYINIFITEYLDELEELIADVDILLSEKALEKIVNAYELSLNNSLEKLSHDIDTNVNLTEEYFEHFYQTIQNDEYLINVLANYHIEEIPKIKMFYDWEYDLKIFSDEIDQKERTTTYYTKYNQILSQWNYTQKYLKNQLGLEVLEDYKKIFIKIKELLQSMINFEPLENLIEPGELEFYTSHANSIKTIQSRIDKYFSEEIFENKYTLYIDYFKNTYTEITKQEKEYIQEKHESIIETPVYVDNVNDFCILYKRKICYGCTNCAWNTYDYGRFCIVLTPYENNYLKIIKPSYNSVENNLEFNITMENLWIKINQRVEKYNSIIKILESNLTLIKNQTFDMDLDSSNDYLILYAKWVKNILDNYYGHTIIKSSYNYYFEQIKDKSVILLEEISNRWKNAYKTLFRELQLKCDKIQYTMYEFNIMGQVYQEILKTDLIYNYFNSIVLFEKTEFNYTITQYYEYFYRLINNSYNYIMANLPKEDDDYNSFFMERKNETNLYFEFIFNNITISENNSIDYENQKAILKVEENDFFQINSEIKKSIETLDEYINDKIDDIYDLEMFESSLEITQISLTTRFYLENREFSKLLDKIYESLEEGNFFNMNFDKFRVMMLDNWIFDSNDFVNILNNALYGTNKEIINELKIKFEEYSKIIEEEISKFFDDDIENIIHELYSINIKELNKTQILIIKQIIKNSFDTIKTKIKNDVKNINSKDKNYYTLENINNTINYYKNYIPQKINESLLFVLNEFYENIKTNVFTNCIETSFNQYLEIAKRETNNIEFGEIKMLNSTYNIGDIIYKLISNAVNKYSVKTRKRIYFEYLDYYDNILASTNFTKLQDSINKELDDIYKTEILDKLNSHNKKADKNKKVSYDLKDSVKKEINTTLENSITNIETIITTTKGSNFQVNFDCPFDFTDVGSKIIIPMLQSLKDILDTENEEQISRMNQLIQNTIISNLENFLENVVPSFGNEFFDRIIDYNINFKIIDLYSNLHYAIGQNFLYLASLGRYTDSVEKLPIDLKYRIFRLNDIDHTIESKRDDIIELLDVKLNELIFNLTNLANRTYTLYIQDNKIIQDSFSPGILKAINDNLMEIMPRIEKEYNEALEKYLKIRFKDSFTKILNEETENMLKLVKEEKSKLISELDKLFSEKIDEDLHEVNKNIFNTIIAIRKYFNHSKTFFIPENIYDFFRIYANISIVTSIETFRTDLENLTFTEIINSINNKSLTIRRINTTDFYNICHEIMDYFGLHFYNPIISDLNYYNTPSYEENLEKKRDEILGGKKLRLLNEDGEEEKNIELKRQETQDVEDTFDQLYSLAFNMKNTLYLCLECNSITLQSSNNNYRMSLAYKILKVWIKRNRYSKNIQKFLLNSLDELYYILLIYYTNINLGITDLRGHMIYYSEKIFTLVLSTRLTTAHTLNKEYQIILDSTKDFNITYYNLTKREKDYEYKHKTEHMINRALVTFTGIKEYTEFQFETFLKTGRGLFKTPYVKARIVDTTRPEEMVLNVRAEYGFCGRTSFMYNANFSDANYTLTLDYNTKTNNINITTYTNFEKYYYDTKMYQIPEQYSMENISYFGYTISFLKQCYSQDKRTLSNVKGNEIEEKHYNETMIIVG